MSDCSSLDRPTEHPLGPLVSLTRPIRTIRLRIRALLVLLASTCILALAAWLEPAIGGFGTHTQLGLAGCAVPMLTGFPCPTCGMTTAFAFAVRGQFLSAFFAQPAGLVVALAVMIAALISLWTLATGRSIRLNWYRVNPNRVAFGSVAVILTAWAFKIVMTLNSQPLP